MTTMSAPEITSIFESVGAIRQGHFVLSSGLHSATYVQCALVLQYPLLAERLGRELASRLDGLNIECVSSPAIGGIVLGQEVARGLASPAGGQPVRAIFAERDSAGILTLRRGFSVAPGERVAVIEDVWTTGGSTLETIHVIEEAGGRVVAVGALIDRSAGEIEFPVPARALLDLRINSFAADDCPMCLAGSEPVRPGSRHKRPAT
ncbi:MAG: orotate phosphoribosyltransferase, partial [Candidatus Acidiferrales bacterium]